MCLLSVWRPKILPLDHQIMINSMIRFHLKWWMDTNRFVTGSSYPSTRTQCVPLYGPQFLWMGSSFRADETILSWSLDGRSIPAPYQCARNNGHSICTRKSHNIYSPFLCHDIYGQHNSGLLYQQTRRNSLSQPMLGGLEDSKLVSGTRYRGQSLSYSRQNNILADHLSRLDKPINTEWALDQTIANSIFQMPKYPNVDLFATRFNHKLPLYVSPVPDSHALAVDTFSMNWNSLHAYAFPPTILISSFLAKICQSQCRIVLIAPFWPQWPWFSELLLLVSAPIRLPLCP